MKKIKRAIWAVVVVLTHCLTSCGLINIEFDPDSQLVSGVTFNYDTIYVMERDSFILTPYIYPDNANPRSIYWETDADSLISFQNDTIVALQEGWAKVKVTTVSNLKSDSCYVRIMPRWEVSAYDHLYDMVIYADVNLGSNLKYEPKSMILGAFRNGYCVGIGEQMTGPNDLVYTRFRCWTDVESSEDGILHFILYNRKTLQINGFKETIPFDGQTHGSLSDLVKLNIN